MNDNTSTPHSLRYYLDLLFKIIGAAGVFAAIYFGYQAFNDNDEDIKEIYAEAELLSNPLNYSDSNHFHLLQFELEASETEYLKHTLPFAAIGGPEYTTYSLDPNYDAILRGRSSGYPVFSVVINNQNDAELLISSILYRVHRTDNVQGGNYGPLSPNVKYRNGIR